MLISFEDAGVALSYFGVAIGITFIFCANR